MAEWFNSDELLIKYGPDEVTPGKAGEVLQGNGDEHVVELDVVYTDFAASPAIIDDNVVIPSGVFLQRVEIITTTAFESAGDAFVFNVGLQDLDRSTEIDYNGLVAALPQSAVDAAGEYADIKIGHTYVGADIGTLTTAPGYITIDYDTAAPTAGAAKIRIVYSVLV